MLIVCRFLAHTVLPILKNIYETLLAVHAARLRQEALGLYQRHV